MSPIGSGAFSILEMIAIAVIAIAAAFSVVMALRGDRDRALSVLLQLLLALSFGLLLFPPATSLRMDRLSVLTPGDRDAQRHSASLGAITVALPGADAAASVERAPDLATALRRHPGTRSIDVVGRGLPPRDLPAASRVGLSFAPAPLQGIVELDAPDHAPVGGQWLLHGRVAGRATQVQLRDVSGAVVDHVNAAPDGGFVLSAIGRAPGPALFKLQALDAQQAIVDQASVPVVFRSGAALTMLLRAAGPDPEQKYWRRWAADAGVRLSASIGLSDQIALHEGDTTLDAATLSSADLVMIDERAWATLTADEKSALLAAVDQGLGLLLRVTGPIDAAVAAEWAALGLPTAPLAAVRGVSLDRWLALQDSVPLTAAPVAFAGGVNAFIQADGGEPLAAWSARGQGRVGALLLMDSFRLKLQGESGRYGTLWSGIVGTIARARPQARPPQLPQHAWVDERQMLCGIDSEARLFDPQQHEQALLVEQACAAIWPEQSGWYHLQTTADDWPFYVRAGDDATGLRAARDLAATQALVSPVVADDPGSASSVVRVPLPRWPFLLAWLLLAAIVWWRERRLLASK